MEITDEYINTWFEKTFHGQKIFTQKQIDNLREAMEKYLPDKWWELEDIELRTIYQANEPILMMPMEEFQTGLDHILGFGYCVTSMVYAGIDIGQTVRDALKRNENKKPITQEERDIIRYAIHQTLSKKIEAHNLASEVSGFPQPPSYDHLLPP